MKDVRWVPAGREVMKYWSEVGAVIDGPKVYVACSIDPETSPTVANRKRPLTVSKWRSCS